MKVVKMMAMAGVLLAAGAVFAADEEKKDGPEGAGAPPPPRAEQRGPRNGAGMRAPRPGGMPGMGMDMMGGNWVSRFLTQDENLDKLGLEGDARKKLVGDLGAINEKMTELQTKIREASMEQGRMMREAMDKPGSDMEPVYAKVKEIGNLRTEQSLLSTKVLVVIRDNLTKEQNAKVRELMMSEGRQRVEARREFNGNMERRRPQFGGGRGGQGGQGGPEGRGRRRNREGGDQPAE